jgi:tetratricopeptide (TPR) repeat protein
VTEEAQAQPVSTAEPAAGAADPVGTLVAGWKRFWQAPALLVAFGLLGTGVVTAVVTAPEPNVTPFLNRGEAMIERGEHQESIALLNEKVYPWLSTPGYVKPNEQRRYHELIARAIALGQRELGLTDEQNYASVVREFQQAESMGATLGPADLYALAEAHLGLGQTDKALQRAARIEPGQRELRDRINRRVIDGWLESRTPRYARAQELLTEMLTDPSLPMPSRVWALSRRAKVQLGQGFPEEAITRLVRALPRLEGASPDGLADLALQLGRGYLAIGAIREAREQFERVQSLTSGPAASMATALLGRVHESRGELVEARDLFASVAEQEISGEAYLAALLGLGEVEARLHNPQQSIGAYERLIEGFEGEHGGGDVTVERVTDSLLARHLEQMMLREFPVALRYAGLASGLYQDPEERPSAAVLALANGHAASADAIMGDLGEEPVRVLAALEPSSRAEAQRHLIRAATHYRDHADRYLLEDIDVYSDSLWKAGDLYDRAGDQRDAIEAFGEYANSNPSGLRYAETRYRLGRAYQAMGEFDHAAKWYQGLIDDASDGNNAAAGFAVRSYVPLAQCYLFDGDAENDPQAEELLIAAVDGTIGQTRATQFHESLIELGSLYYRTGRYERGIERLTEAMARDAESPEASTVLFRLADSHRLLADEIDGSLSLNDSMPDRERQGLRQTLDEHRRAAMPLYAQARDAIESKSQYDLTSLDRLYRRNTYFYLGDCAFDQGDYDTAIQYYDAARERYPGDPASLVAMVQIVNAHIEQGDIARAQTANERAKRFYLSLPESAWDDPNLPMDREDWERWLESSTMLYEVAEGG